MSCCSNFFDDWHWDACICLWQLTGDLYLMVSSIRVTHLLAHCVLIGSLVELLFSFYMRSVLAFLQIVDAITGKVMSSMVIVLAFKSPLQNLTLSWFSTKNEVIYRLTILVVLDCTRFWLESLAISVSVGLNHIRLWREPSAISILEMFNPSLV